MAATPSGRQENYPTKQWKALSICHIILGVTCFVCQVVTITLGDIYGYPGVGIWGGLMMVIAGGLGLYAAKRKKKRPIIAFMIVSILAALAAIGAIVCAALGMGHRDYVGWSARHPFTYLRNCVLGTCHRNGYPIIPCVYTRDAPCETRVAMNCLILICGVVQVIVTLYACTLVICCRRQVREPVSQDVNHVCHRSPADNSKLTESGRPLVANSKPHQEEHHQTSVSDQQQISLNYDRNQTSVSSVGSQNGSRGQHLSYNYDPNQTSVSSEGSHNGPRGQHLSHNYDPNQTSASSVGSHNGSRGQHLSYNYDPNLTSVSSVRSQSVSRGQHLSFNYDPNQTSESSATSQNVSRA